MAWNFLLSVGVNSKSKPLFLDVLIVCCPRFRTYLMYLFYRDNMFYYTHICKIVNLVLIKCIIKYCI